MLTGEIGGSHKEEVFCILCWLMVASHTECFGESALCIGVLFHFEGGGLKSLYKDRDKIMILVNFRHNP